MSHIDWFFSISVIAVHIVLAIILIRNWLSFHLRWLSLVVIVRIFTDFVLLSYPMDETTYFYLFFAFQVVAAATFWIAWFECKSMIQNSDIKWAILVYLIPESIESIAFLARQDAFACYLADKLRIFNLLCMVYICIIMMRRKGNPNAIVQPLRS